MITTTTMLVVVEDGDSEEEIESSAEEEFSFSGGDAEIFGGEDLVLRGRLREEKSRWLDLTITDMVLEYVDLILECTNNSGFLYFWNNTGGSDVTGIS